MAIHEDALDLIMYFEGCQNEAYACPAHVSNGGTWPHLTIGYGHSGPDVYAGMKISTAQAKAYLARDMANVETYARRLVRVKLDDAQFGAFCCILMNVKPALIERSKMLQKLNVGEFGHFDFVSCFENPLGPRLTGMAREWAEFRLVTGRGIMPGLVKRRAAELELFFTGNWSVPGDDRMPQQIADPNGAQEALRPGARSSLIADLHEALTHAGFPVTCGDAYTWVTAEAVKAFQQRHGLTADGIYGPQTAAKLDEVLNGGA
ncbi:peptidoglycan-binding protein [uncultured Hyphomicrobium sp.]|uniref:glycoside hydrolase family protein n=1 Tax=uncultured Hyphomicrobium sp. TaxID=194373 RepID=UPI0025EFDDAA|nr:peptidoglycan-binding protein [uncultured Hyphomicrobium sp.]